MARGLENVFEVKIANYPDWLIKSDVQICNLHISRFKSVSVSQHTGLFIFQAN
jgi:hypothetical protein